MDAINPQMMLCIFCTFSGIALGAFIYRVGLRDGLSVQKGESLQSVNPVQSVKRVVRAVKKVAEAKALSKEQAIKKKAEERYLAELAELMAYDGADKYTKPGGGIDED